MASRNKALEALVQEATTRPLAGATEEIKRIDLREAGEPGGQASLRGWHLFLLVLARRRREERWTVL